MKKLIFYIAQILGLAILTLTLFWATNRYIIFNDFFLDYTNLKILYYILPTLLTLILCLIWIFSYKMMIYLIRNLIIVFIGTYFFISTFSIYGQFCEEEKNMDMTTMVVQFLILMSNIILILKYIIPNLNKKTFLLITISISLVILDFLFLWISFSIFNSFL